MLRSSKFCIELPACSKQAQNAIEKNINTMITNIRSRSTFERRNASYNKYAKAITPAP
jgi:hypothetical protein